MRSILIALLLLTGISTVSLAQCDKKVSLYSSKSEHLDGKGSLQDSADEKTTVVIDKTDITVAIINDNGDQKMTGNIKSKTCDWKVPFKEGKTTINTVLTSDNGGDAREFNITIEGKDGKVTLTAVSPERPDRQIRLVIEKFEEVK